MRPSGSVSRTLFIARWVLVAVLAHVTTAAGSEQAYDLIIRNGRVLDGSGNPAYVADIALTGDRIAAIGDLAGVRADRTIDATGLYVVPGFIDLHSHADRGLVSDEVEMRRAVNLVAQGITTVVGAPDGSNQRPSIDEEIAAFESCGIALNVAPMIGHSTVRSLVMGADYARAATPQEIARMQELVRNAMERGAWGLSAGLEYRIGRFSRPEEVVALAKMVAPYDGFYIAHQRSEIALPLWQLPSTVSGLPVDGTRALAETIDIARETGIRVVASHAKAAGTVSWGTSTHQVRMVDEARAKGLNVYFDQYVYTSAGNNALWNRLPMWAFAPARYDRAAGNDDPELARGGLLKKHRENLLRVLRSPAQRALLDEDIAWLVHQQGGPERLIVVDYPDATLIGRTVAAVAAERNVDYKELLIDLALKGYDRPGGVLIRGHAMDDGDVVTFMKQEYTATSSDAEIIRPGVIATGKNPRAAGAFVRKLAHYVKDREVITLPFAIRAATSLPAHIIGLQDRGQLRPGSFADIVVFDLKSLRDNATVLDPAAMSTGIEYVLINGVLVVEQAVPRGALPGRVLRRDGARGLDLKTSGARSNQPGRDH